MSDSLKDLLSETTAGTEAEMLILEATELLCDLLAKRGWTRAELARALGRSRGRISQVLNGGGNLTLRTFAEMAYALGHTVKVRAVQLNAEKSPNRVHWLSPTLSLVDLETAPSVSWTAMKTTAPTVLEFKPREAA